MRWSQTVRLNLANDNRKIAVNSLVLATDDIINISNIDQYTVADFKKVLDFGRNVLVGDIDDSDTLAVRQLQIGNTLLTTEQINNLISISENSTVVLDHLSVDSEETTILSSKSIDVSGYITTGTLNTKLIEIGDFTSLNEERLIFTDNESNDIYSYLSKDKLEIKDSLGVSVIQSGYFNITRGTDQLSWDNGDLILSGNDSHTILRASPGNDESYIELNDSAGNMFGLSPGSFNSSYESGSISFEEGILSFIGNDEDKITTLYNDTSGSRIELKSGDEYLELTPTSLRGETENGTLSFDVGGDLILKNIHDTSSIKLSRDSSGSFFEINSEEGTCVINPESIKISNNDTSFEFNESNIEFNNVNNNSKILINSNTSGEQGFIELLRDDEITKVNGVSITTGDVSGGSSIQLKKDGISYSPDIIDIENSSQIDIFLDFEIEDFGPELKVYVNSYDMDNENDGASFVILVNLGSRMNNSKNTNTQRYLNEYIKSKYTDCVLSFDNLYNDLITYSREDKTITIGVSSNKNISYGIMRVS